MAKKLFPDGTEVVPFYVRAIRSGPFVFVSGTTSLDAKGRVQGKDAAQQTKVSMRKIEAALKSAGSRLADLTRMTIFGRAMLGPPEPSPRRAPHLSKIAPSSLQRAASCSSVCCAWTRESGAAARDATAACGRTASSASPAGGGRRRDTIRAGRCEVVLRKRPVIG